MGTGRPFPWDRSSECWCPASGAKLSTPFSLRMMSRCLQRHRLQGERRWRTYIAGLGRLFRRRARCARSRREQANARRFGPATALTTDASTKARTDRLRLTPESTSALEWGSSVESETSGKQVNGRVASRGRTRTILPIALLIVWSRWTALGCRDLLDRLLSEVIGARTCVDRVGRRCGHEVLKHGTSDRVSYLTLIG